MTYTDSPDTETATVTASNGVRFTARLLREGDHYGARDCLVWDDARPGVEFYDTRFPHTALGQFVARYDVESILNMPAGLLLYGGVPDWRIDGPAMDVIRAWLRDATEATGVA